MKIELQNPINYHVSSIDSRKQPVSAAASSKAAGSFDAITINSESGLSQEQQFVSSLTSRLSIELRKPANAGMIQDLQEQIKRGTYEVDVNAIVDRIMLY